MTAKDLSPESIAPIWDAAMGRRLKIARMAMDLDQSELAKDLGVSQSTVSKLEDGRTKGTRAAIPLSDWSRVLGAHVRYVITGWGARQYDEKQIRIRYLLKRYNGVQKEPDNKDYVNRRLKRLGIKRKGSGFH